jgi:hypothetical protein
MAEEIKVGRPFGETRKGLAEATTKGAGRSNKKHKRM